MSCSRMVGKASRPRWKKMMPPISGQSVTSIWTMPWTGLVTQEYQVKLKFFLHLGNCLQPHKPIRSLKCTAPIIMVTSISPISSRQQCFKIFKPYLWPLVHPQYLFLNCFMKGSQLTLVIILYQRLGYQKQGICLRWKSFVLKGIILNDTVSGTHCQWMQIYF